MIIDGEGLTSTRGPIQQALELRDEEKPMAYLGAYRVGDPPLGAAPAERRSGRA